MNSLDYHAGDALLPEVLSVGWGEFRSAALGGPRPDGQEHVYEICYIDKGTAEWWVDDEVQDIGPGNAFINQPCEWHGGTNAMLNPCEVYWVQIIIPETAAMPGLTLEQTQDVRQNLESPKSRFFPASSAVRDHFERLLHEYRQPTAHSAIVARATLHNLLIDVVRASEQRRPARMSPEIQAATDWIEAHLAQDFDLDTVARVASMSKGHFSARFTEETGFSPNDYRIRRRIHLAKSRLRDPRYSITEIAHELGFSSSQYFSTVFKKFVGITPGEYRQVALP